MKYLKATLAIVGGVVAVAAAFMLYRVWLDLGRLMAAVRSYMANAPVDPTRNVFITAGLTAAGFLILGIAVAVPRRGFAERRAEAEASEAARKAEAERRAAEKAAEKAERDQKA